VSGCAGESVVVTSTVAGLMRSLIKPLGLKAAQSC
jgi:hypothetical protein